MDLIAFVWEIYDWEENRMFARERQDRIVELIEKNGAVRLSELTQLFSVSVETIRRDLLDLEKQNCLRRVHGGALRIPDSGKYLTRKERQEKNSVQKEELVQYASGLIQEKDVIMIDCGSTATAFAQMLADRFDELTVITNSMDVFELLRGKENYTLYLCTGFYSGGENAFYGPWTLDFLDQFHAKTSFIFPSAVSLQYGIMDYNRELYAVQKKMISRSDRVVFCADSDKFEKSGLLKLADLKEGSILVTDCGLKEEIAGLYRENNIRIIRGSENEQ